ncbi:MAG: glycosyltransferase [Myxococcota bacterium]
MSSLRLFRICTTGPYADLFFRFADSLVDSSFEDSMQACRENGFLYPGGLRAALEAEGAEVMEILVDVPDLQKKWLREADEEPSRHEISETLFKQIGTFRPDVVYFQTFLAVPHHVRRQIRQRCPTVRRIVGHRGFPIMDCSGYEDVDAVFLGYPEYHDRWHAVGVQTFFHLHSFDEQLLPRILERNELRHDLAFAGTTGWGFDPHDGRYYDLRKMLDRTDLRVWGNEPAPRPPVYLGARERVLAALVRLPEGVLRAIQVIGDRTHPFIARVGRAALHRRHEAPARAAVTKPWYEHEPTIRQLYPDRIHPALFGLDYLRLLASTRVTWNRHLEMDGAGANMRVFEACGVGTCMLTDHRPEVVELFEPDREIVTYKTIEECIDKARYLLEHESERKTIARAGQSRALRDHSTARRARELHAHLLGLL